MAPDLGFNVDTSGLDKAQASLDKTTQSAASTEQQANKTSAALSGMGSDKAAGSISKTAQSADQLAASLVKATSAAQQHLNVAQALETIVTKTGVSYAAANTALTAAISANASAATAAGNHAAELGKVAQAAATVTPKLTEAGNAAGLLSRAFGGGGGGGGGSIGAMAAGLGGLLGPLAAVGAGFIAVGVAALKSSDDWGRAENRLQGITGSIQAGTKAFNEIRNTVAQNGAVFGPFEKSLELASQNLNKLANGSWPVISLNANKVGGELSKLNVLWDTLQKAMEMNKATGAEEAQVLGQIAKEGGLTAQSFETLRSVAPTVATAVAKAFNYTDLNEFQKHLEQMPVSLENLEAALGPLKAYIDRTFDPSAPQNWEQATRRVGTAWNDLKDRIAETGAFNGIITLMGKLGETIHQDGDDIKWMADGFTSFYNSASQQVSSLIADYQKLGSVIASVIAAGAQAAASAQSAEAGAMPGAPQSGIQLSPDSSGDSWGGYPTGSYGAFATGGSFTVQGSGGTDSQLVSFHATPGEVVTISGGAGSSDAGGTTLAPSGHVDTGGSTSDMAIIDAIDNGSTAIVNAIHGLGGGTSLGGVSSTVSSSGASLQRGITNTAAIVGIGVANGIAAIVGIGVPGAATLGSGGGGGGGGSGGSSKKDQLAKAANAANPPAADAGNFIYGGTSASPGSSGSSFGVNVPPSLHSGINFINPSDPFHPFNTLGGGGISNLFGGSELGGAGVDTGVKTAVKDTTNAVDQTKSAVDETTTAVNTSGDGIVSSVMSSAGSIVGSIASLGSEIASAIASAASASANAGASGGGTSGGGYSGGGGGYGSGYSGGGYSDTGGYSGGGVFDLGGGSEIGGSGGSAGGDMTGSGSFGGFDPGMIDYGGGDPSLGYFATGGQFHVSGPGGRDSQPVRFMATPGEVVTITPPGLSPPPSPTGVTRNGRGGHYGGFETGGQFSIPGGLAREDTRSVWRIAAAVKKMQRSNAIPGGEADHRVHYSGGDSSYIPAMPPPSQEQNTGTNLGGGSGDDRNVTIMVQAGVQAEQFLRSRAQIVRAFRG